jgi:GWxTD domain-containing protein
VKRDDGYLARYQISIGIKNQKGIDLSHKVWSDSIKINKYLNTKSNLRNRKHFFSYSVEINKEYSVFAELIDLDTRKRGLKEKKINLKRISGKCELIKPTLFLGLKGEWGYEENIIPTNGVRVRELGDGVTIGVSGFIKNEPYTLDILIKSNNRNDSLLNHFEGNGKEGFFNEKLFIESSAFIQIKNDLKVVLKQGKKLDSQELVLSTFRPGISNKIGDIELALKQMSRYVLTNNEQKSLKGSSRKEKEVLFVSYWKKRDNTPKTQYNEVMHEFYNRIDYVNEHFDGWQPGWETDRGQIYILFGPPDNISRSQSFNSNTISQLWSYYRISKQFTFIDQNGFGDYRLNTPFLGFNY